MSPCEPSPAAPRNTVEPLVVPKLWFPEESLRRGGAPRRKREKRCMTRKLVRQLVAMSAGFMLAASIFFGVGWWRRSGDAEWCRQAAAGGMVAGDDASTSEVFEQVRSACRLQRERQRVMFGAVWRRGGQEAAKCGFELARLQLISDHDLKAAGAILQRYGIDDADFETGNREGQDRFVRACLASRQHEAG